MHDDLKALEALRAGIAESEASLRPLFEALNPIMADLKNELEANTLALRTREGGEPP